MGGSVVVAGVEFKGLKSVPTGPGTAAAACETQRQVSIYFSKHKTTQMMTVRPLKPSSEIYNYNKLDKSKVQPYCILEQLKPRQNKPQYVHKDTHTHRGKSKICR